MGCITMLLFEGMEEVYEEYCEWETAHGGEADAANRIKYGYETALRQLQMRIPYEERVAGAISRTTSPFPTLERTFGLNKAPSTQPLTQITRS